MELVNRETNFNKVFNSSPNVGVLDPLSANRVCVLLFYYNLYFTTVNFMTFIGSVLHLFG